MKLQVVGLQRVALVLNLRHDVCRVTATLVSVGVFLRRYLLPQ